MLRRRSTPAVARRALGASVLLAAATLATTVVPTLAEPAPALTSLAVTDPAAPSCAAVVAAASLGAPGAAPADGWTTWWSTSTLGAVRHIAACAGLNGDAPSAPAWRAQVALRLAAGMGGHQDLGQWLLRTAFPPQRVANPLAALIDQATDAARVAHPACGVAPSLVAAVLWTTNPSLVDGDLVVADDGTLAAGDAAGLASLRDRLGTAPPVTEPPQAPPTFAATVARTAAWLCERPVDLATPEGRDAAAAALLGDVASAGAAAMATARMGEGPLDPHVVLPRAAGRDRLILATVGPFRVRDSLAPSLEALLADAAADGLELTGGAYRSSAAQVERRRANCAGPDGVADDDDIYRKPSEQCSPPTARPGRSMHESGEAVDFERCQTRDTPCYRWLARYAHRYGLWNLPEEPWHWSVNGQ